MARGDGEGRGRGGALGPLGSGPSFSCGLCNVCASGPWGGVGPGGGAAPAWWGTDGPWERRAHTQKPSSVRHTHPVVVTGNTRPAFLPESSTLPKSTVRKSALKRKSF